MFQSAPPCGGRPSVSTSAVVTDTGFNPRPRAGGDPLIRRLPACDRGSVSIRAPVRGATLDNWGIPETTFSVSIRAPVRGATIHQDLTARHRFLKVSIRAPVRGATLRRSDPITIPTQGVSIRAPVRGATHVQALTYGAGSVSIRAPVRGATLGSYGGGAPAALAGFQSAPPCGGRLD